MDYSQITPVILTFNESRNIRRTLEALESFNRIIVVDSFSTDDTKVILDEFDNVRFYQRRFDDHASQWNYGLRLAKSDWVLTLDADYVVTTELLEEIKNLDVRSFSGFSTRFEYFVYGEPLYASILPGRITLFNRREACYFLEGHTQRLRINGAIGSLAGKIRHDDRKPLTRWLWAQDRYSQLEMTKLNQSPIDKLKFHDRIRKMRYFAPLFVFFYCLIIKGCILNGKRGFFYSLQRMYAELLLSLRLIENELYDEGQT